MWTENTIKGKEMVQCPFALNIGILCLFVCFLNRYFRPLDFLNIFDISKGNSLQDTLLDMNEFIISVGNNFSKYFIQILPFANQFFLLLDTLHLN